jgi:hypothetical protein
MLKLSRQEAARKAGEASARRSFEEKSQAAKKGWQTRRNNRKKY